MKIKKQCMRIAAVMLAVQALAGTCTVAVNAVPAQAAVKEPDAETKQADIGWRFKIENGKLYKRLYHYTKGCWVGDWIFVRNVD